MGLLTRMLGLDGSARDRVRAEIVERDVEPLEGTNMSLWNSIIPNWWTENGMNEAGQMFWPGNGILAERVWISNRCIQMNSQQIASMPLQFEGPPSATAPAWLAAPDPAYFPNGISDAIFAVVRDIYAWGFSCLAITMRYADGYPRNWTVLPSRLVSIHLEEGEKAYSFGGEPLDPADIVQIDRNPGCWLHGESAIRSYAQMAWGLLAAGNQSLEVNTGGVPKSVLKSQRKLTDVQATKLQQQWQEKTQKRGGAPPVLPPELDFEALQWNPKDMALLETQDFNALAIATAYGIPAILVNMSVGGGRGNSSLTYQNPAMLGEMWWRFELRPTAKRIADALTAQMLPAGQWVWFDATDTFLQVEPQNSAQVGAPVATSEDDPQAANNVASASPAQQPGAPVLTSVNGGAAQ